MTVLAAAAGCGDDASGSSDGSGGASTGTSASAGTTTGSATGSVSGSGSATSGSSGGASTTSTGSGAGSSSSGGDGDGDGGSPPVGEIDCRTDGDGVTTLVFVNRCATDITWTGSELGEAALAPGAFACVDIGSDLEPINSKRYWGWRGANPGAEHHTLAEFTFNTDFNDFDWYNISHVDAHNVPMSIVPVARDDCHTLSCPQDFLAPCPEVGRTYDDAGEMVSCYNPNRDDPQSPVSLLFEACDDAYAWSGDDQNGDDTSPMRACAGEDWDIVFCP
jgi:hypothetical protein